MFPNVPKVPGRVHGDRLLGFVGSRFPAKLRCYSPDPPPSTLLPKAYKP